MATLVNGARGSPHEETRADVRSHGFWRQGTTALFGVRIVNLDAGLYLHMTPDKSLVKVEKKNKDRYP